MSNGASGNSPLLHDLADRIVRLEYPTYLSAPEPIKLAVMTLVNRVYFFLQEEVNAGRLCVPPEIKEKVVKENPE